jgi:hypothetical protein
LHDAHMSRRRSYSRLIETIPSLHAPSPAFRSARQRSLIFASSIRPCDVIQQHFKSRILPGIDWQEHITKGKTRSSVLARTQRSLATSSDRSHTMSQKHIQDEVYTASISDPEEFWQRQAKNVYWHKKPSKAFRKSTKHLKKSNVTHDHWEWFADGEISTPYNCVDRHVLNSNGEKVAICWDSPGKFLRYNVTTLLLTISGTLSREAIQGGVSF